MSEFTDIEGNEISNEKIEIKNIIDESLSKFIKSTGIDKEDALKLLSDYVKQLPEIIDKLNKNICSENLIEVSKLAHQLKGASGNLRIDSLYKLAIDLEKAAINNDLNCCKNIMLKIQ
jgi:HPt (histidine-containing phosphotransfer) domain-containing protein